MVVLASEQPEVWYGSRAVAIFFYRGGKSFSKMFVTARTLRCQALAFDRFESGPVPRTVRYLWPVSQSVVILVAVPPALSTPPTVRSHESKDDPAVYRICALWHALRCDTRLG